MKKIAETLTIIAILTGLVLSGCGKTTAFDIKDIGDTLSTEISFQDQMTPLDKEDTLALYNLTTDDVTDCISYVSSGATAEEIGVFQGNNKNGVDVIMEEIKSRMTKQKEGYSDYNPAEVPKLENYVLISNGNYVVLCVSDDNAKAEEILQNFSF